MPEPLSDPCPLCGFNGQGLRPPDIVATYRSLGRRWAGVQDDTTPAHAAAALDAMLAAARPIRAEVGRFGTRPEADAAGIGEAAGAIAEALEGPDEPFQRDGVHEAALAGAHAGIHHLRLAEKAAAGHGGDAQARS